MDHYTRRIIGLFYQFLIHGNPTSAVIRVVALLYVAIESASERNTLLLSAIQSQRSQTR